MKEVTNITDKQSQTMSVVQRMKTPTPKFLKALRTIGLALAAVDGTLLASPIALPVTLDTIAGYATLAGSVITVVIQTAVKDEQP